MEALVVCIYYSVVPFDEAQIESTVTYSLLPGAINRPARDRFFTVPFLIPRDLLGT